MDKQTLNDLMMLMLRHGGMQGGGVGGPPLGQNPLTQMGGEARQQMGMDVPPSMWPSQLPQPAPDPPPQPNPMAGVMAGQPGLPSALPQPPAHQTFIQRFLAALRGNPTAGTGTGSQSSAPLQPSQTPAANPQQAQIQALIRLLLQRSTPQ